MITTIFGLSVAPDNRAAVKHMTNPANTPFNCFLFIVSKFAFPLARFGLILSPDSFKILQGLMPFFLQTLSVKRFPKQAYYEFKKLPRKNLNSKNGEHSTGRNSEHTSPCGSEAGEADERVVHRI